MVGAEAFGVKGRDIPKEAVRSEGLCALCCRPVGSRGAARDGRGNVCGVEENRQIHECWIRHLCSLYVAADLYGQTDPVRANIPHFEAGVPEQLMLYAQRPGDNFRLSLIHD